MASSWMVDRLNADTRIHHPNADLDLDALFRGDVTATHYLVFLIKTYGFEAPFESALALTPRLQHVLEPRVRARAGQLARDMMALSMRPHEVAELPLCMTVPQFRGVAEALGWLYVVERMTLAHNVVRRHLMTRLPIEMEVASAYLRSYDGVVGKRWQELGDALDEVSSHPAIADRVVEAAGDAFRCRRLWSMADQDVALARNAC